MTTSYLSKIVSLLMVIDNMVSTPIEYTKNGFNAINKSGESVSFFVQECSIHHAVTTVKCDSEAYLILMFTDKLTPDNVVVLKTEGIDPFLETREIINLTQFVKKFHVEFVRTENNA